MSHRGLCKLTTLVFLAIPSTTRAAFGPGEAAGRSLPGRVARHDPGPADFKVVVWYRTADPIGTFKYEIYDLRKGEYTARVDDWVKDVKWKYPAYFVVVRDVDLTREKGETERLKVGAVISRELVVAARAAGIVLEPGRTDSRLKSEPNRSGRSDIRPPGFGVFGATPEAGQNRGSRLDRLPGSPGGNRDYVKPSPTPFPVPVPFPRVPR